MKRLIILVLSLMVLFVAIMGCSGKTNPLVGKWQAVGTPYSKPGLIANTIEFAKEGKPMYVASVEGTVVIGGQTGLYRTFDNNRVNIIGDLFTYSITNDQLTLTLQDSQGSNQTFQYVRTK